MFALVCGQPSRSLLGGVLSGRMRWTVLFMIAAGPAWRRFLVSCGGMGFGLDLSWRGSL